LKPVKRRKAGAIAGARVCQDETTVEERAPGDGNDANGLADR
jgi:hypothetical protein